MLILLYGHDSYRRIEKKRGAIAEFVKQHPAAVVQSFDFGNNEDNEDFADYVGSQPLFGGGAKLAVVDGISWDAPVRLRKIFERSVGSADTAVLVSSASKPPQKEWGFLLKKSVSALEFEYLEEEAWKKFLRGEAEKAGVALSAGALERLAASYEKNTWGGVTELARLAGLQKKEVSPDDVEAAEAAGEVFPLALSFKSASPAARSAALEKILSRGESLQSIFFLIASLLSNKTKFAAYDAAVKGGKFEWEEALLDLALSG